MSSVALDPARLAFNAEGIPCSVPFDDVYHSGQGGAGQTKHVFIAGNDLPARWRGREIFTIVETGFGLGLNFLETWAALRADPDAPERLHFVSAEKHPFCTADLEQAHARVPVLEELSRRLRAAWPPALRGFHRLHFDRGRVTLTLLLGDAVEMLSRLDASVDAFYLDGFSPSKNPDMWSPALFAELARLAAPDATLATWTVAGGVRHGLESAGFAIEKRPGFGAKREMLAGRLQPSGVRPFGRRELKTKRAIIIGAGLAGTACAERLAARGWDTELIEREQAIAQGASGNPSGVLHPIIHAGDTGNAQLSQAAFLYALGHLKALTGEGLPLVWEDQGLLQLPRDGKQAARFEQAIARNRYPAEFVHAIDAVEGSHRAGHKVAGPGLWFPRGGWTNAASVCAAQLACSGERFRIRLGSGAARFEFGSRGWTVFAEDGSELASAPVLILASASDCTRFVQAASLPLERARGQISLLPTSGTGRLHVPVCGERYCAPLAGGGHCVGASFDYEDDDTGVRTADHAENLERLDAMLPGFARGLAPETLEGRVAFRATTPDRMPVCGALQPTGRYGDAAQAPGLYVLTGLGARGLAWAPLLAEFISAQLNGEPLPLPRDIAAAIDPARFRQAAADRSTHSRPHSAD